MASSTACRPSVAGPSGSWPSAFNRAVRPMAMTGSSSAIRIRIVVHIEAEGGRGRGSARQLELAAEALGGELADEREAEAGVRADAPAPVGHLQRDPFP